MSIDISNPNTKILKQKINPKLLHYGHKISQEEYMKRLEDREGIFEHKFKCLNCLLEFKLYSYFEFKHKIDNVYCPECGKQGNFLHNQITINTRKEFDINADDEIYKLMRW